MATPVTPDELRARVDETLPSGTLFDSGELVAATDALLDTAGLVPVDGRAAETVTERALRYWRTLGLVDPPAGRDGRRVQYRRRHGLQVLALRAAQAAHRTPLATLQSELFALPDDALLERFLADAVAGPAAGPAASASSSRGFWAAPTAPAGGTAVVDAMVFEPAPGVTVIVRDPARICGGSTDPDLVASRVAALIDPRNR